MWDFVIQLLVLFFSDDELLSDSFPYKELFDGALWEVEGKVSILNFRLFLETFLLISWCVQTFQCC